MTNKQFDDFLEKTIKNYGKEYVDFLEEWNEPHEFSPRFKNEMAKLIKRERKPHFHLTKTSFRKFVAITTAAIIASSSMIMTIGANNDINSSYLRYDYPTNTLLMAAPDDAAPKSFKEIYEITAIPEEYEIIYKYDTLINIPVLITMYQNEYDSFYNFDFTQNLKFMFAAHVNTEFYEMEEIEINGCEGRIVKMDHGGYLTWDNGDYMFEIVGSIDINLMIKMAESVQKVE